MKTDRTFEVVLELRYIGGGLVIRDGSVIAGGFEEAMALYRRMLDASRNTSRMGFVIKATHTGSFVVTEKPIAPIPWPEAPGILVRDYLHATNWTSLSQHAHVFATRELAQAWCDEWNAERGRAEVEILPLDDVRKTSA